MSHSSEQPFEYKQIQATETSEVVDNMTPPVPADQKSDSPPALEYGELLPDEQEKYRELERQFTNPRHIEIDSPECPGKKLNIEYVILDVRTAEEKAEAIKRHERTVLHVPGFTASYRGPEEFVKIMALREKKRVIIMSQPSTGKSDPAPTSWRKWRRRDRSFEPFAEVLNHTLEAIRRQEQESGGELTTEDVSIVSSSMGSMIATEFAVRHPEKVRDLVLMHPAGIYEENVFELASRYFPESMAGKVSREEKSTWRLVMRFLRENVFQRNEVTDDPAADAKMVKELEAAYCAMAGKSNPMNKGVSIPKELLAAAASDEERERLTQRVLDEIPGETPEQAYRRAGGEGPFNLQAATDQLKRFYRRVALDIVNDGTPNTKNHPFWRFWEALTIAKGGLLQNLPKVQANLYIISSSADKMFPGSQMELARPVLGMEPGQQEKTDSVTTKLGLRLRKIMVNVFPSMRHDAPYMDLHRYVGSIGQFLDEARELEATEQPA